MPGAGLATAGSTAFVYPGQGTQRVGMGAWFHRYPCARDRLAEASEVVGRDVVKLCLKGPAGQLAATANAQVAIVATSAAAEAILTEHRIRPGATAGHSVGELNALITAGVLSFADGLRLVARRGALMERVPGSGAMGAIVGLSEERVEQLCRDTAGSLAIGLYNGPDNFVVSGTQRAVSDVLEAATKAGAPIARLLPTRHAFHGAAMREIADEWAAVVAATPMSPPSLTLAMNSTGGVVTDVAAIRAGLVAQLTCPVRWAACVRTLVAGGATVIVEAGDSRVLSGLDRRISPEARHVTMRDPQTLGRLSPTLLPQPARPCGE